MTVPESFAHFNVPACFLFQAYGSGCSHGLKGSGREVTATTYVGRYPPVYYAIVGLPTLAWHSSFAVYLMRLISGFLTALMVGLALTLSSMWSRSRVLVLAVAIVATPTVLIFGSAVNPSGLEMAASLCVWTGGLILVLDYPEHPPASLVYGTAGAAIVMVLARGLSPFWLAVIAVSLVALAPRSLPKLFRDHAVKVAAGIVAVAGVAAVGYIAWAHALSVYPIGLTVPASTSLVGVVELALGRTRATVLEFIGTFDSAESPPPLLTTGLWFVAASGVLVLGFVASLRRHAAVVIALIAASLVIPTLLMVSQAHRLGLVWQARDGYPLYAGILLVAGAACGRGPITPEGSIEWAGSRLAFRRLSLLIAVAVAVSQFADFVWALRRYTVGLGATVNPFAHVVSSWVPPVPVIALLVTGTLVTIFYGWWIVGLARAGTAVAQPSSPATEEDLDPWDESKWRLSRPLPGRTRRRPGDGDQDPMAPSVTDFSSP